MQNALAVCLFLGLACALGCAGGDPSAVDAVATTPPPPAQPVEPVALARAEASKKIALEPADNRPLLPGPLKYDPTHVTVEGLLPYAWARALDWNDDALLTSIHYETGADGRADLTRNPGALMFNFFSASTETSKLVVPTTRVELALVHSSYTEGHHRIPLPETFVDLSAVLKRARRDGFDGKAYQAVLHSWPDAVGDRAKRCAWTIRHSGHRGSHSRPLLYDAVTGEPTTQEGLSSRTAVARR